MKSDLLFHLVLFLALLATACKDGQEHSPPFPVGVVTAASPEASEAGQLILEKGGNAVDAAVAVAFALGVTEPAMSGLGGGTQVLLALPGEEPIAINGSTYAPAATPADATAEDLTYHCRSTIPSTVRVLDYLWRKYGSGRITWRQLLAPAIRYADRGFAVGTFRHQVYRRYAASLQDSPHATEFFLLPDGTIPAPGDTLRQPVLARTLRRLAEEGPMDFYQGKMAEQIATDMAMNGGWITLEDLRQFPEPEVLPALHSTYRGYDVYTQPPPCGGWTVLLMLHLLEQLPETSLAPGAVPERLLALVRALDAGHQDRSEAPVTNLLDYQAEVAQKLDKAYAKKLLDAYQIEEKIKAPAATEGETTHFSVVDAEGMAVAVTASINAYFGAKAASPQLGFLYNTYMDDFELGDPDHPFAIRPGAMAYSSMSPTMVQENGETVLVLGSPGSKRIISTVAQLTQRWIDGERDIATLVAAPRVHVINGKVYLEDMKMPAAWRQQIRRTGYEIAFPSYELTQNGLNAYFGGVHAIARENGRWHGAADPRRDGRVMGEGY